MKAKYIFTKIGYRKNDLELMYIVPETDEDYDVADIFLSDYYSDEGDTCAFEAEDLDNAVYQANRWFGTCVTPDTIRISIDCGKALSPDERFVNFDQNFMYAPYIPAPVKRVNKTWAWEKKSSKREKKYYGSEGKRQTYHPEGLTFDYTGLRVYRPY